MATTVGNAKNQIDVFRVNDTGTAYTILTGLSGSTAATGVANRAYRFDMIEEAPFQYQEDGTIKLSLKQLADDKDLNDVLNALAKPSPASASRPERTLQNGIKQGGSSSSNLCLFIYYGGEVAAEGVKVTAWLGYLSATSGSHTDKYNEWTDLSIEINGAIAKYDCNIASALFDGTIVNATDVATEIPKINKGTCYERKFVDKAS